MQIPRDQPVSRRTELAFFAPFQPLQDEVRLMLRSRLYDAAAYSFRWRLAWPASKDDERDVRERRKKVYEWWVDRWTNLEFAGPPPDFDPKVEPAAPVDFQVAVPWKPDAQSVGDRFLIPVLPRADLFQNFFRSERRLAPIWLEPGEYQISMTWRLPPDAALEQEPPPAEGKGPQGLEFKMAVSYQAAPDADHPPLLTTTMVVHLPAMLPSTEYAGVKRFFDDLQRTADTRLLVKIGEAQ